MQYLTERRAISLKHFQPCFLMNYSVQGFYLDVLQRVCVNAASSVCVCVQLLRSSLVNNRTQAKVAEELGMQEFAITNDKTKRPVVLRTKTLADLLECRFSGFVHDITQHKGQLLISLFLLCLTSISHTSLLEFFLFMCLFFFCLLHPSSPEIRL